MKRAYQLEPKPEADQAPVKRRRQKQDPAASSTPSDDHSSEASTTTSLQYEPLEESRHIRLLKVHLDSDRKLRGGFVTESLDVIKHSFTAISYCWGDFNNGGKLWFDDTSYLELGEAANEVLRKWATRTPKEYLWIDAVCLNQDDDVEKAQQVQHMREIYEKAESVMISLPTKYHGWGAHAVKYVDFVASLLKRTPSTGSTVGKSAREAVLKTEMIRWCSKNAGINALARIVDTSPYLSRTWIIQEIVSASFAEIDCDGASMRWKDFAQAVLLSRKFNLFDRFKSQRKAPLSHHFNSNSDAVSFIEKLRRRKARGEPVHANQLFLEARYAKVTEPLDKIFALRGLAVDLEPEDLVVDYRTLIRELYSRATKLLLMHSRHKHTLRYAGLWRHIGGDSLPSWAIDFRPVQLENIIKDTSQTTHAPLDSADMIFQDSGDLLVRGRIISSITSTLGPTDPSQRAIIAGKIRNWYRETSKLNESQQSTPVSTQESIASQNTTSGAMNIANTADEVTLFTRSVAQLKALVLRPKTSSQTLTMGHTACLHHLAGFVSDPGISRKLIVTESDHVGLAPAIVHDGDIIAVFYGYKMPFVLRRNAKDLMGEGLAGANEKGNEEGVCRYTLIGEAFVPGLMNGEATEIGKDEDIVLT
jgi:hypothetical protein